MTTILDVNIVSMGFSTGRACDSLINNLSFSVPEIAFVSFLGPSGSGKTTMLRIIAGLEKRFEGRILLDQQPVTRPSTSIQVVFQDGRLLPWKTVRENVGFVVSQEEARLSTGLIDRAIQAVHLQNRADSWPKTLSGGEESRVALARVLIHPPRVLLLDEPFRNLDVGIRNDLQSLLLTKLADSHTTAIQVSHSIEDAVFLSDTIHCVSKGPMTIVKTFQVDVPKPRQRTDPRLREVYEEVLEYVLTSQEKIAL